MQKVANIERLKYEFYDEGVRMAREHGFISLDELRTKFYELDHHDPIFIELIAELCNGFQSVE
ncbi:hypothetical protein GV828_00570 [Flavobacterium sp. NST-5]|uniref:Uncharacterized protein n=1 Tax=Flavobacterium ichthyis TaxID=2698827 RepID=A0ABW9Z620_9FLAO|nr:hypothetical protein [Flavobacterium ichthyis]NBL63686.1 hypothetical protein [Flavobacterium ichthyis]